MRWLRSGRGLARYAACVLGFMVLVILEGAVVRATGSGAGCGNHWPLCNGEVIPHHPRIATMIEFAHRSLTGVLVTLAAALITWVFVARERGTRVRRAAVWVGVLLVTEALLGAVLVKGAYVEKNASDMRVFVQCVHFTNTMLLVAALALTWWWARGIRATKESIPQGLKPESSAGANAGAKAPAYLEANRINALETKRAVSPEARSVAWLAVVATIVVGATGSVAALADTLFPSPSLRAGLMEDFSAAAPLLVRMRWVHPAAALAGVVCVAWLCVRVRGGAARWLGGLMAAQLVLGVGDVLLLAPTWMQVLHLLGADLYWIALVVVCAEIVRLDKKAYPRS
jgi:cytochrome c oxidase assembly protein subunit 15